MCDLSHYQSLGSKPGFIPALAAFGSRKLQHPETSQFGGGILDDLMGLGMTLTAIPMLLSPSLISKLCSVLSPHNRNVKKSRHSRSRVVQFLLKDQQYFVGEVNSYEVIIVDYESVIAKLRR